MSREPYVSAAFDHTLENSQPNHPPCRHEADRVARGGSPSNLKSPKPSVTHAPTYVPSMDNSTLGALAVSQSGHSCQQHKCLPPRKLLINSREIAIVKLGVSFARPPVAWSSSPRRLDWQNTSSSHLNGFYCACRAKPEKFLAMATLGQEGAHRRSRSGDLCILIPADGAIGTCFGDLSVDPWLSQDQ